MKPRKVHGAEQTSPQNNDGSQETAEMKSSKKSFWTREIQFPKSLISVIFTVGVFVLWIFFLGHIEKKEFWDIIVHPVTVIFSLGLVGTWIWSLISGKSQVHMVNKALWAMLIIMMIMIIVPWAWEKSSLKEWYDTYKATDHRSPAIGTVTTLDYDDATGLEKGLHKFNLPDSGNATEWIVVKKDVRNWSLDYSQCPHYRFLVVFSDMEGRNDRDTIKTWVGGAKEIWGKKIKIVAMAPMSPSDSLGLILK